MDVAASIKAGKNIKGMINGTTEIKLYYELSDREKEIIIEGGKINYIKKNLSIK
jgi:hypothetical protein